MNYLLDTCAISDFFKKIPSTIHRLECSSPQEIHVSSITVMEIEYGLALNPEKEKKIRPVWDSFLETIEVLEFCNKCATRAATLRANLKSSGLPIGPYDILIAGTALAYNMIVVTSNLKEFTRMSELTIEDWRI